MIPSFFVYLDKTPLALMENRSCKSLPVPDLTLRVIGDQYIAQVAAQRKSSIVYGQLFLRLIKLRYS